MTESSQIKQMRRDDDAMWRAMPRRNTQKVSHLLAADLRHQILNGQLAADEQLPSEAELTARL
ncbi:MAG TPA: hypothetical protein VED43_06530, partial [Mycobacterium sp.]|nr:hypothetical protein [Mycobacterium sp.]